MFLRFKPKGKWIALSILIGVGAALATTTTSRAVSGQAGAVADVTSTSTSVDSESALIKTFTASRHLSLQDIAKVRPGSVRQATLSDGSSWATASFVPSASASPNELINLQNGRSTAVFTHAAGQPWHLVQATGSASACGQNIPGAVMSALHLTLPPSCQVNSSSMKAAATNTLPKLDGSSVRQNIVQKALSQVGVSTTPTETNFNGVDCDPYSTLMAAFSPNANGCGPDSHFKVQNENEFWCSDFAKWAWNQAGITTDMNTIDAAANSFYTWGADHGESMPIDSGTPAPGDAIVFFPAGSFPTTAPSSNPPLADHVGIVASVNPDGTVNMVNGDFLSSTEISVQYDTNLNLSTWPSQEWAPGEQWLIVSPPSTPQQPAPKATISGPNTVVEGTNATFTAQSDQPNAQYAWTLGDGRTSYTVNPSVNHVFAQPGIYTVTVTATSSTGAPSFITHNVTVLASSATTSAIANTAVWYSSTSVAQYLFGQTSQGKLTAQTWDESSWLLQSIPGQTTPGGGVTSLTYPDPNVSYTTIPHVYYRSTSGTLSQTYLGANGWATQTLAGSPAANSPIVAASVATSSLSTTPAIFYVDSAGHLGESYLNDRGTWVATTLSRMRIDRPSTLTLANSPAGPRLFYVDDGIIMEATKSPVGWISVPTSAGMRVAPSSSLSAVATGDGGTQQSVFFLDKNGHLAEVSTGLLPGAGTAQEIPGTPAASSALAATDYGITPTKTEREVFYTNAAHQPMATLWNGSAWQTATLPGTTSNILGVSGYPALNHPEEFFFSNPSQTPELDSSANAGTTWTTSTLPNTIATFVDRILLYAASPSDYTTAVKAANAAGLPTSQVITSFSDAWNHLLSGNYLVTSVGTAATNALYYNACGWSNSSDDDGSTPFYITNSPLNQLPGANLYQNGAAADPAQAVNLAIDLAYYAIHGHLPNGVTSLPATAPLQYVCSGQPS